MLTFTKVAAIEMSDRISDMGIELPEISTFHAFARKEVVKINRDISLAPIIQDNTRWMRASWIAKALKDTGLEFTKEEANQIITDLQQQGRHPSYPNLPFLLTGDDAFDKLKLYAAYHKKKSENPGGFIEFQDFILSFLSALRSDVRYAIKIGKQYDHVMVDEFQDSNDSQESILEFLCQRQTGIEGGAWGTAELMVVGDSEQSIYSFAQGSPSRILQFNKKWGGVSLAIAENYRSGKPIIDAANSLIENNIEKSSSRLIHARPDINAEVSAIYSQNTSKSCVRHVEALLDTGTNPKDIAVLFRTNAESAPIESAMSAKEIPFRTYTSKDGFFGMAEVKTILAYLRAATRQHDLGSLMFLWGRPTRYLKADIVRSACEDESTVPDVFENILSKHRTDYESDRIRELRDLIFRIRGIANPKVAIEYVIEAVGYIAYLHDSAANRSRPVSESIELINKLKEMATGSHTVSQFLDHVDQIIRFAKRGNRNKNSVHLMTVHKAKGREFPAVIVTGLNEGVMPHKDGIGEEERRIAYVAMTRAQRRLILISDTSTTESRFISEAGLDLEVEPDCEDE